MCLLPRMASVAALAFIALCAPLRAQEAPRQRTYTHVMADTESRLDARKVAVQELQRQAAAEAASLIEARTRLEGDILKGGVTEIITGMVRVSHVVDEPEIVDGRPALRVTADTQVDEDSVLRRLAQLRDTSRLKRQVESLALDNARLEEALLRERLSEAPGTSGQRERATRERIQQGLTEEDAFHFSVAPSISGAARANLQAQELVDRYAAAFETNVVSPLMAMPVAATLDNLAPSSTDGQFSGLLRVTWDAADVSTQDLCWQMGCEIRQTQPTPERPDALGTRIAVFVSSSNTMADFQFMQGAALTDAIRVLLARWLSSFDLMVEVRLGAETHYLPLLGMAPIPPEGFDERLAALNAEARRPNEHRLLLPNIWPAGNVRLLDRLEQVTALQARAEWSIPVKVSTDHLGPISARIVRLPRACSPWASAKGPADKTPSSFATRRGRGDCPHDRQEQPLPR